MYVLLTVLFAVFLVAAGGAAAVLHTKIYNVRSFTCLINGEWAGSSANQKDRELARQGDAATQGALGFRLLASGVCYPGSLENRREGLEWMQKAAENESSEYNVEMFYSFARLYREESPSFLPAAERMVMNTEDSTGRLLWDRALIERERGEKEWSECRELVCAHNSHYCAEVLARGLGGEADRGKAAKMLNDLYASSGDGLGGAAEKVALTQHMRNLGLLTTEISGYERKN